MSFLDVDGLKQLWSKSKSSFVKSVSTSGKKLVVTKGDGTATSIDVPPSLDLVMVDGVLCVVCE